MTDQGLIRTTPLGEVRLEPASGGYVLVTTRGTDAEQVLVRRIPHTFTAVVSTWGDAGLEVEQLCAYRRHDDPRRTGATRAATQKIRQAALEAASAALPHLVQPLLAAEQERRLKRLERLRRELREVDERLDAVARELAAASVAQ